MNIVYLIGNGFDINLEMRTKYEHFYEYYLSTPGDGDSPHIKKLKDTIAKEKENWSDLEEELGKYLNKIGIDEAVMLHSHLIKHLSIYLKSEEDKIFFDEVQKNAFWDFLKNPHSNNRLLVVERNEINNYINDSSNLNVNIITFNYTKTIEKLSGYVNTAITIGTRQHDNTRYNVYLSEIEHVHGFVDKRMILGVNDATQIANEKLRNETRITDRFVKSDCNSAYGLEHDKKCQRWINTADLVCLFGLSFGETDKKWWETIGEVLKKGSKIILFEYNTNKQFNENQGPDLKEEKEAVKDRFLSKTKIDDSLKGKIKKDSMYVAFNTDMFKLDVVKKGE